MLCSTGVLVGDLLVRCERRPPGGDLRGRPAHADPGVAGRPAAGAAGAGTGRDAGAFAAAGYDVVAVEPSPSMRAEAERRHASSRIRWLPDTLPGLAATSRLGLAADLVSLSAVWQHVAPPDRPHAFRKLVGLLRSGGLLALTLRHGPDDGRGGHPVSPAEVEALARSHGMQVLRAVGAADRQGRPGVS